MLRPRACLWFELIASRDDLAATLQALAIAGAVELQTHRRPALPWVMADASQLIERFDEMAKRYRAHWPAAAPGQVLHLPDPEATLRKRLAQLQAWCSAADPLIAALERLAAEQRALADLARLLRATSALPPETGLLTAQGRVWIEAQLLALPGDAPLPPLPAGVLPHTVADDADGRVVLLVGSRDALAAASDALAACKARRLEWPADLRGSLAEADHEVALRQGGVAQRTRALQTDLHRLAQRHDLAAAVAEIDGVAWLIRHGTDLPASERLVWVTGWTVAGNAAALCAPLERLKLHAVVRFGSPPPGLEPPSRLDNPAWIRRFEAFARLLGQPGPREVDPSAWVALIAPLMFGFMFGDVGQGALLCAVGWLLRRRIPLLALLVPGGAMAMLFGLLFGSVFAREDLLPALWLHPLQRPVTLLAVAVAFGAAVLLGGLVLSALQAHWRGEARRWWARDAGLVLAYLSLLCAWACPPLGWLVGAGAMWFAFGSILDTPSSRAAALAGGLAQFVEQVLQLTVNTVSFARVGAFALAHAGLSLAVVGVAEAAGGLGYWVVLVLGNAVIIGLEGLVVGIQTTRLLLFEFFVRFVKGSGRPFRPLQPPWAQNPLPIRSPP